MAVGYDWFVEKSQQVVHDAGAAHRYSEEDMDVAEEILESAEHRLLRSAAVQAARSGEGPNRLAAQPTAERATLHALASAYESVLRRRGLDPHSDTHFFRLLIDLG